jgi:hypothetical protein
MKEDRLKDYLDYVLEEGGYFGEDELDHIMDICNRIKQHSEHVGYRVERIKHNPREKAFHEMWIKENDPQRGINSGWGILQDLFINDNKRTIEVEINKRDRVIVATVIQWLGSNCGMGFLEASLEKCGYRIVQIEK